MWVHVAEHRGGIDVLTQHGARGSSANALAVGVDELDVRQYEHGSRNGAGVHPH